jgi:Pyruvate/2-oxoacid:ferredoxin oxidoreductase gamma subunit
MSPINILIAALGGEGGGVMADWLMEAATASGLPAQATSIPGVAQRTGATTYYLEIFPAQKSTLNGKEPVLSLTPSPGNVDIMVASELVEAGRAMQNGYVSPERTTLIASTHRIYATVEKMQMADGRFDSDKVVAAGGLLAKKAVMFDMRKLAQESGTVINAVLFGAMAGSGVLPLSREVCESAIRKGRRGAEASLRGFAAGFEIAGGSRRAPEQAAPPKRATTLQEILPLAEERLKDYQGERYAEIYAERVSPFGDARVSPPPWRAISPPDGLRGHHPRRRSEDSILAFPKSQKRSRREGWRAGGSDRLPEAGRRGVRPFCLIILGRKSSIGRKGAASSTPTTSACTSVRPASSATRWCAAWRGSSPGGRTATATARSSS